MENNEQRPNDQPGQASKRTRLMIDISPDLRRRIKIAAARQDLSMKDYVERILEQVVPAETPRIQRRPINKEAVERLDKFREELMRAHPGETFGDSAEEVRQMREERARHLEELR
jgi:predicted metal-dependent RNase